MGALDEFWGLPPGLVATPPAPRPGAWETVEVEPADGLDPLAGRRLTLPPLAPPSGEPVVTARRSNGERVVLAARREDGNPALAFDPEGTVAQLTARAAMTRGRPASARLPFAYHRVPAPLRRVLRDLLTRRQADRADAYPAWPVEPSVEAVRLLYLAVRRAADPALVPAPFWPDGRRFALVLTHDVDTAAGLARAPELAADEHDRGLASCSYVVGGDWPLDDGALGALREAGGELGLHDAAHDNRIAFMPAAEAGARLDHCRDVIERYEMRGFRSPSMLRSPALYDALRGRFAYDSSIPDTGLLPEPNGCATVFPLRVHDMDVLPLTLPPDGQLLGRGLEPAEVVAAWIAKAEWVASVGGVAVHLTHPEHGFTDAPPMREAYRRFLEWAAAREDAWHALPATVIEHWAARTAA